MKDRSITPNSSGLHPRVLATADSPGRDALRRMSWDESQAMIQSLILELSVRIPRLEALLGASSSDSAHGFDDLAALGWIRRSLEDVEATTTGLTLFRQTDG